MRAAEGERVKLTVEEELDIDSLPEPLRRLARVYDGLPEEEIQAIEAIILDRSGWSSRGASEP